MRPVERARAEADISDVALIESHGLGSEATLVDLGAGTGTFALAAASAFGCVIGGGLLLSPPTVSLLEAIRGRPLGRVGRT